MSGRELKEPGINDGSNKIDDRRRRTKREIGFKRSDLVVLRTAGISHYPHLHCRAQLGLTSKRRLYSSHKTQDVTH